MCSEVAWVAIYERNEREGFEFSNNCSQTFCQHFRHNWLIINILKYLSDSKLLYILPQSRNVLSLDKRKMFNHDMHSIDVPGSPVSPRKPTGDRSAATATQQWTGGRSSAVPWWMFETPNLFNDPPMTDTMWVQHHSWLRHLPEPVRFFSLIYGLWPIIAWSTLVTVLVGLYAELLQGKNGWPNAVMTGYLQPFILTSFAVALLLVFRTNSSYDRWWEARKSFGLMYNCVRNIVRLTSAWLPPSEQPDIGVNIVRWASILGAAAMTFLRDDPNFLLEHEDLLTEAEMDWLLSRPQPPIAVLQVISSLLRRSSLETYERCEIERQLASFDIVLGACERIRRQCIPLAYTRQTSRFLITYVTFMPFGLWAYTHWLTIPIMMVITMLLVGVENIGIQCEQPLMVLPLSSLAAGCRAAVEGVGISHAGAIKFASASSCATAVHAAAAVNEAAFNGMHGEFPPPGITTVRTKQL